MASSKKASFFHPYLAVDFGRDSMQVYRSGKGLLPPEPSMVLLHRDTREPLAVGDVHSPSYALHPLGEKGILHYDLALVLLQRGVKSAGFSRFAKVQLLMAVPSDLGDGERKLLHELALDAGVKRLSLIPSPLAGYFGEKRGASEVGLHLVLDMGESFTSLALISRGEVVREASFVLGGRDFSRSIVHYVSAKQGCLLGHESARLVKESIATLSPTKGRESASICTMCLQTGLPKTITLEAEALSPCLLAVASRLGDSLSHFLSELSPLQVDMLRKNGVLLVGGASLLSGLCAYLSERLDLPFYLAKHPKTAVIEGLGYLCEEGKVLVKKGQKEDFFQRNIANF